MPTRTELVWDGKYDAKGNRVAPLRVALPFQTVETVNEPAGDRKTLFSLTDSEKPWRNRLIWGDKKYVLPSLLPEFAGKVNLIYIDPPFDTGADFSFTAAVPEAPDDDDPEAMSFTKQPSAIEQKAYRDTWGRGIDSYLQWFYETAVIFHELLAEDGSIYVHLDYHIAHYAKPVLDEVFSIDCFRNQIIWKRTSARSDADFWGPIHDTLFFYTKSTDYTWNTVYQAYDQAYVASKYTAEDSRGRYRTGDLTAAGLRNGDSGKTWRGIDPATIGGHWKVNREAVESIVGHDAATKLSTQEKLDLLDANNFIYWPKSGRGGGQGVPQFKRYMKQGVVLQDLVLDLPPVNSQAEERLNYPTQKPEALLDRIIRASSNEDDLVLDCFCGSGTTAAVAEKLGRRWIACDLGRFAIHTTRKRLLAITGVKPFNVLNLGKYERQLWQTGRFAANGPETSEQADKRHRAYVNFILELYHAQPVNGYTWIHGKKGNRLVHVGGVDGPVTDGDVKNLVIEFKKAIGNGKDAPTSNGVDVLGWDFAFEMNELARQQAEAANIQVKFKRIPHDVMDKRACEQGDIHFFEMAALGVKPTVKKREVHLELTDFVIPPDDVPEEVREKVKHWSQWIDFWAVDWNHAGDTFHNEWQTFRTKKAGKIVLATKNAYPEPGDYRVMVKVIDILGNDTTKTLTVKVK